MQACAGPVCLVIDRRNTENGAPSISVDLGKERKGRWNF